MTSKPIKITVAIAALAAIGGGIYLASSKAPAPTPAPARVSVAAVLQGNAEMTAISGQLKEVLANYRKIIVLLADEESLSDTAREQTRAVGQGLFHDNQERIAKLNDALETLTAPSNGTRFESLDSLLAYIESDSSLFDADRLAFRELLQGLLADVAQDTSLPAIKMHKRISEDLEALAEIERNYEKEIRQIFGRFETRAIELKREKWDDYVAHLKQLYSREQILKDFGVVLPYPAPAVEPAAAEPKTEPKKEEAEIFGTGLPKKTIVLTFDDGPHKRYTEEISAILKQYGVPAVFFNVGRNLGRLDADGHARLSAGAEVSRKLMADGYVLGNHSFSHAQLSKQTGDNLKAEILNTDTLLKAIDTGRSPLFRFPYGARNKEGMDTLADAHLKSVMWNIDSLDWADPVPSSIVERVLHAVDKAGRGIILFHDIHERTVKALPAVLDRLVADGYQFAGWDGSGFKVAKGNKPAAEKVAAGTAYANSWAVVIGIDSYEKWPKLQYAVRDAQGVRDTLVEKFGFAAERVVTLKNAEATRNNILAAFHDKLAHGGVQKNDRIFVFFAGHGATRKLSSGRELGYIVPYDSDPNQFATDAIPMTEIQNIAESLSAKHTLFVMDACYSGLGLTRGAGNSSFLRDNAKRIGRQMLTAGGGDQLVADGGPNGHSVFTWTLLQGLNGKADLNGDGLITATELAAYVAPAVSSVSNQTPAFGSLPGSEGGDFVFELPAETEFLSPGTTQLSSDAIALNSRLDAARPAHEEKAAANTPAAAVTVKDLQGREQKIVPPLAVPTSARQLAQRANDRGLQFYKEKQYPEAVAQFTEALKLRPDFALAANNLGFVFYKQEKYKEAARWFENTVKMDPSRAVAYLNLGDAHALSGDTAKARLAYRTYLELAPNGQAAAAVRQKMEKL
ncbi:polysaccharide deacetylase family protein [Janthinobacterium agaricidamnosum]|uniref:polysaccharide deacetylase family protein n=1 Tax=Janthinobacterium agaricidamnosum TaxID=55508 RepID=UPI00056F4380|nr:polysaccharide deacetylase family protein [Janthinobacterium agaricidamnosum]